MSSMLEEREAFLRAIFDEPEDDTSRLVYADWLEEHGEEIAAKAIRLSIESYQCEDRGRSNLLRHELSRHLEHFPAETAAYLGLCRLATGYPEYVVSSVKVDELLDLLAFRQSAVARPELFETRCLYVRSQLARIVDAKPLHTIFGCQAFRAVRILNLDGDEKPIVSSIVTDAVGGVIDVPTYETRLQPTITQAGVEALANHRGCRQILELSLRNNNLGNDALRFLAKSPYLHLNRLDIAEGNSFRGRVWQLLIERFGEDVVS